MNIELRIAALALCGAVASAAYAQSSVPGSGAGTPGAKPPSSSSTNSSVGSAMPSPPKSSASSSGMGNMYGGSKSTATASASSAKPGLGSLAGRDGTISRDAFLRYMANEYDALARQHRGNVTTNDARKLLKDAAAN